MVEKDKLLKCKYCDSTNLKDNVCMECLMPQDKEENKNESRNNSNDKR